MVWSFVSLATNPANALESHPCIFGRYNSPKITSLRKNTRGEGVTIPIRHPSNHPGAMKSRKLSQLRQNLLLIRNDRIQRGLILQNRTLILLDRLLIGLDRLLIGNNRGLIRQDPLLIRNASVGHGVVPSEVEFKAFANFPEPRVRFAIVFLEGLESASRSPRRSKFTSGRAKCQSESATSIKVLLSDRSARKILSTKWKKPFIVNGLASETGSTRAAFEREIAKSQRVSSFRECGEESRYGRRVRRGVRIRARSCRL